MTSRQSRETGAPRRAGRGKIVAAFVALSAAGALGTGEAEAAPFCAEGWAALEAGAGLATGDLGVSGNYGPPASGGGSFTNAVFGFDAGVRVDRFGEGMGGMTSVQPPPPEIALEEVTPYDALEDEIETLEREFKWIETHHDQLVKEIGGNALETRNVRREMEAKRAEITVAEQKKRKLAARLLRERDRGSPAAGARGKMPCKGPVIGVRGRLPVDGKGSTRQAIHPFPSQLTSIGYETQWMLTLYIGYMLMLQAEFANNPLAFTPWAGVTMQRGELSMRTDELGTVSNFSEDVTRVGPSIGLNVDVPLDDDLFIGVGIQGDFLPEASAMGTSPSFSYRFSRERSFEYSGFARLGIRW